MLTLQTLEEVELSEKPLGQKVTGWLIRANFQFPGTRTRVVLEGLENLPSTGKVFIAMNHTDRYNYWPFQVELWKQRGEFTATWVKGKYFNNEWIGRFMVAANNIPAPSKGYIITMDATDALEHPPSTDLYRLLRTVMDDGIEFDVARAMAEEAGVLRDFDILNTTPREMLGLGFDPRRGNFIDAQRLLFRRMMDRFVDLNYQAFDRNLKVLVFPEGTRSLRLGEGKPGLAQMAVRMGATVVPVGCNGSDALYPGDSPLSQGGTVVYRIGEPLTPEGELGPFQLEEDYRPFTREAEEFSQTFAGFTDVVMERIEQLLDPQYRRGDDHRPRVEGNKRFL